MKLNIQRIQKISKIEKIRLLSILLSIKLLIEELELEILIILASKDLVKLCKAVPLTQFKCRTH